MSRAGIRIRESQHKVVFYEAAFIAFVVWVTLTNKTSLHDGIVVGIGAAAGVIFYIRLITSWVFFWIVTIALSGYMAFWALVLTAAACGDETWQWLIAIGTFFVYVFLHNSIVEDAETMEGTWRR